LSLLYRFEFLAESASPRASNSLTATRDWDNHGTFEAKVVFQYKGKGVSPFFTQGQSTCSEIASECQAREPAQ
jgi:hypothetical protein